MYNAEVKLKFINSYTNNATMALSCEQLFNKIEPIEESHSADISQMDPESYTMVLNAVCGAMSSTSFRVLSIVRDYLNWSYAQSGNAAILELLKVKYDQSSNMREALFSSPQHLAETIDKFFHPVKYQTVHNVYRAYIWLCYMGLPLDEFGSIEKTDVDFSSNIVHSQSGAHGIYMEAIPTFLSCAQDTAFRFTNARKTINNSSFRDRGAGNLILRRFKNSVNPTDLRQCMVKITKKQSNLFRYDRLHLSGILYKMYQRELDGLPVEFNLFAEEEARVRRMYSTSNANYRQLVYSIARQYKADYANWKVAFNL